MSTIIKGMEMPTGCAACDFCNVFADPPYCRRLMKKAPASSRLNDCPLVPVPPHGRLGDLDFLFSAVTTKYRSAKCEARQAYRDVLDMICDMETIIEAEGK